MADAKRNPKKMSKPFLWMRRKALATESQKPGGREESARRQAKPWYRPTLLKASVLILGLLLILPMPMHGQFGLDTAAILAALSKMQSLMSTYIAAPLR